MENLIIRDKIKLGRPKKEVDEKLIIKEYGEGISSLKLSEEFGISVCAVLDIMRRNGVSIRKKGSKAKFLFLEDKFEEIKQRYILGESAGEIAILFNVQHHVIEGILRRNGIEMRGMSAFGNLNEDYFHNIDSEEKAYWLGFLAADGNVSSSNYGICLDLNEKDIEHVKKFKYAVSSCAKLYCGKNRNTWSIFFKSKVMWVDLVSHGVVPNKSKILDVPKGVSGGLMRHFYRGLVDGDGCIFESGLHLVGSEKICSGFAGFCLEQGVVGVKSKKVDVNLFGVDLYGANAEKIIDVLYLGATVFLDRKNNDAKKVIKLREDGVVKIARCDAEEFLQKYHYLGTLPMAVRVYGWVVRGVLIGVAVVGATSSQYVGKSLGLGGEKVCELRRFALLPGCEKNSGSSFLSKIIKRVKLENEAVAMVSYADDEVGHLGILYQACSAYYLGCSDTFRVVLSSGERISNDRHFIEKLKDVGDLTSARIERVNGKHKYVFALRDEVRGVLKGKSLPYPKKSAELFVH